MEEWYKSTDVFEWDPTAKRAELFHRSSRFLLVGPENAPETDFVAYSMFRFDTEENMEGRNENVLYCYELQVTKTCRGHGLGKLLVQILEKVARQWSMEKIMLTVLTVNIAAIRFYQREGCHFTRRGKIPHPLEKGIDTGSTMMSIRGIITCYRQRWSIEKNVRSRKDH
ncbi:hypothetical protein K439DRAFT_1040768 [Ramaria rubella]|nr:hypothetical protein K439DRAFT_1040768 [Ramaria rubella]